MATNDSDRKWVSDQLEAIETNLLTEFHKFAAVNDARVLGICAAVQALEVEIAEIRTRIAKIERHQLERGYETESP